MRKSSMISAMLLSLILVGSAFAAGQVIIGGYIFQCQHSCSVRVDSNGGILVYDSEGGWVQKMVNGRAIAVPSTKQPHR